MDVDITVFNSLATNFPPSGVGLDWTEGNFDMDAGDGDVDITDFNVLATNFAPGGYSAISGAIPEPTSWLLAVVGGAMLWGSLRTVNVSRRKCR